jgi:hypothetical protein
MSSILRKEASRANGAKSHGPVSVAGKVASAANSIHAAGPVTPEGLARSAQNATRHGMLAQSIVLSSESAPSFVALLAGLQDLLQPENVIENRLVEVIAVADWRRSRLWCLEMALYTHGINAQERANDPCADQENSEIPSMHTSLAFTVLSDQSRAHELLNRYEVRYGREYQRTLNFYYAQRADRKKNSRISKRTEPNMG